MINPLPVLTATGVECNFQILNGLIIVTLVGVAKKEKTLSNKGFLFMVTNRKKRVLYGEPL